MKFVRSFITLSLFAASPLVLAQQISCESKHGQLTYCSIPAGGGNVFMVAQSGKTPCLKGKTWGLARGQVWVNKGCRGEFAWGLPVGTPGAPAKAMLACAKDADAAWHLPKGKAVAKNGRSNGTGLYEFDTFGGGKHGYCIVDAKGNLADSDTFAK